MTAFWQPGTWAAGFWQPELWRETAETERQAAHRGSSRALLRGPWLRTEIRTAEPQAPEEEWLRATPVARHAAHSGEAARRARATREREDFLLLY